MVKVLNLKDLYQPVAWGGNMANKVKNIKDKNRIFVNQLPRKVHGKRFKQNTP